MPRRGFQKIHAEACLIVSSSDAFKHTFNLHPLLRRLFTVHGRNEAHNRTCSIQSPKQLALGLALHDVVSSSGRSIAQPCWTNPSKDALVNPFPLTLCCLCSIAQRCEVVLQVLRDRDSTVEAMGQKLLGQWLNRDAQGCPVKLLNWMDVEDYTGEGGVVGDGGRRN